MVPLQSMRDALIEGNIQNGTVLISTSENGGTASFAIPKGLEPLGLLDLVQETIQWLSSFTPPEDYTYTKRTIRRMRASFSKAVI